MSQLSTGAREVTFGFSDQASRGSRAELDAIFERLNAHP